MFSPAYKIVIFLTILFLILPVSVQAQEMKNSGTYKDADQNNRVFNLLLGHSLSCNLFGASMLTNSDGTKNLTCMQGGTLFAYSQLPDGGVLGGTTHMVAGLFQPSLSTNAYLAEVVKGLGVESAYAEEDFIQGSGNQVIMPVLRIWQYTRNFSYFAFTFIFVIIGVMIMLRQKINAQTFVSIQSALPNLVIGLILVTFSYYLAALMVDTAFYGMYFVAFLFTMIQTEGSSAQIANVISNPVAIAQTGSMFDLWKATVWNSAGFNGIIVPLGTIISGPINVHTISPGGFTIPLPSDLVAKALLATVGGIAGFVITLIIGIALIVQMLRLFWSLLQSYIAIMIQVVLGPIYITLGSFPGKGSYISSWWKTILGHALVFPAVFATFLFGGFFLFQATKESGVTYTTSMPLITGVPVSLLPALIGFGILLGSTAVPGMVKKAIGVQELGAISTAALEGLSVGSAGTSIVGNIAASGAANYYYNWAKDKRTGSFHRLNAERMKNSWMNKRFGLDRG